MCLLGSGVQSERCGRRFGTAERHRGGPPRTSDLLRQAGRATQQDDIVEAIVRRDCYRVGGGLSRSDCIQRRRSGEREICEEYGQGHIRGLRATGSGHSKIQRRWDSVYRIVTCRGEARNRHRAGLTGVHGRGIKGAGDAGGTRERNRISEGTRP